MNTPNPLQPQGSLPSTKSKKTVHIVILTIVAFHAVFFTGLLMQGCKPDDAKPGASNTDPPRFGATETSRQDSNSFYSALPEFLSAPTNASMAATEPAGVSLTPAPLKLTPAAPFATEPALTPLPAETKEYAIATGDTLAKIAKDHHTTVGELIKVNPGIEPRRLTVGKKIQIPAAMAPMASGSKNAATAGIGFAEPKSETGVGAGTTLHVIKSGDTLTRIARQHGVTVKALRTANDLKSDQILVGKKLKIPASTASPSAGGAATGGGGLSLTNPAGATNVR